MPDGEIVPLPADDRGLTMLPEIGQENHRSTELYPLDIEELCELLMSRERIRRLRFKDMPDPALDSVMPTANDRSAAVEQTPSSEAVSLLTEADSKLIVTPGADAQAQESELPPKRHLGRLTAKDFTILTDCSVCHATARIDGSMGLAKNRHYWLLMALFRIEVRRCCFSVHLSARRATSASFAMAVYRWMRAGGYSMLSTSSIRTPKTIR